MEEDRTNLLIYVSLVVGLMILIICQSTFFSLNLQRQSRTAARAEITSPNLDPDSLKLTFAPPSCEVSDLPEAVSSVRTAIVNIDTIANHIPRGYGGQDSGLDFDIPTADGLQGDFETLGSGIIVHPEGYILTCSHIISGVSDIIVTVFSAGKRSYPAEIVETDIENDLAVLRISPQEPLSVAKLGNSDLVKVSDTALSIGSPFGLEHTVTAGIISDDDRDLVIAGSTYRKLIQTDAAMNRGSAGGALTNIKGEVIGVNIAIHAPTGVFSGMAFAIPVNSARPLLNKSIDEY